MSPFATRHVRTVTALLSQPDDYFNCPLELGHTNKEMPLLGPAYSVQYLDFLHQDRSCRESRAHTEFRRGGIGCLTCEVLLQRGLEPQAISDRSDTGAFLGNQYGISVPSRGRNHRPGHKELSLTLNYSRMLIVYHQVDHPHAGGTILHQGAILRAGDTLPHACRVCLEASSSSCIVQHTAARGGSSEGGCACKIVGRLCLRCIVPSVGLFH